MAAIFPPIIGEYFVARSARLKAKQEREVREAKEIESSEKDVSDSMIAQGLIPSGRNHVTDCIGRRQRAYESNQSTCLPHSCRATRA